MKRTTLSAFSEMIGPLLRFSAQLHQTKTRSGSTSLFRKRHGFAVLSMSVIALLTVGCCVNQAEPSTQRLSAAPAPVRVQEPPPPVQTASVANQYAERTEVRVSMLPLSSPSYAVAPPPRQSFPEIRQEMAVYTPPPATVYAPAPVYASAPDSTTTGICQIVPAGSVLYSDPPTITLSESGQVIEQTPTIFYPVCTTPGTVTAMQTQSFTTTTYPVASAPVVTTTTYDSQPFVTTTQPVEYSQTTTTYTPTVDYTQTVTYSEPIVTTATYTVPMATTQTAVYYPGSSPVVTTSTFTPASPSVPFDGAVLRLVPATDIPPGNHPNDALQSQWFEIIRPGNAPIRIGRVSSTCVCVSPRVPNRFVGQGERALIEARIVQRPARNNLTYGIFVNVVEPVTQTVDSDITIRF